VLDIKSLTRRFGAFTAVDGLTLSVDAGEVFALLGSNGAGKTTTIKMLTTLLPPSSGDASVAGFSITTQAVDVRRAIGYVPQSVSVHGSLTGYENLLIFAKLYDLPHREQPARVREALEFMGLTADGLFAPSLIEQHLRGYAEKELGIAFHDLLALGRQNRASTSEPFNMAYPAIRGSGAVIG